MRIPRPEKRSHIPEFVKSDLQVRVLALNPDTHERALSCSTVALASWIKAEEGCFSHLQSMQSLMPQMSESTGKITKIARKKN